ncbi:MAG: YdcF family protein [Ignavibacteria bacterium]
MTGFEYKTGNILSIIFFFILAFTILINLIVWKNPGNLILDFLLAISICGILCLNFSIFYFQKDLRIILSSIYLVINLILLSSMLGVLFSTKKDFSILKTIFIFLFIFIGGLSVIFFSIYNYQDDESKYAGGDIKADAEAILGAAVWGGNRPSPVLKDRIDKGFEIYMKGFTPKIIITGGGSPNELTEGEVSKNVLIKYGVPEENLILESESSSTIEQIHFIRDSLYHKLNWKRIIIISDNFHLKRASEICSFNNMNADCISSDKVLTPEGSALFCLKESLALIVFWMVGI